MVKNTQGTEKREGNAPIQSNQTKITRGHYAPNKNYPGFYIGVMPEKESE